MKHLRTFTLSALVLSIVAFGLPTQDVLAYLSRRAVAAAHRRGNHRYCHHSRAWWRRHRQRQRQRVARALILRRQRREATLAAARARAAAGIEPAYVAGPKTVPGVAAPAAVAVTRAEPTAKAGSLKAADARPSAVAIQTVSPAQAVAAADTKAPDAVSRATRANAAGKTTAVPVTVAPAVAAAHKTPARTQPAPSAEAQARAERADVYRKSIASAPASSPAEPTFRRTRAVAAAPEAQAPRSNPLDFAIPRSWRLTGASAQGTLKFAVADQAGRETGMATLSPVKVPDASAALDVITPRTRLIGGVAQPVLRRTIIDRMVLEGGWVTNDMERTIDGRKVYVVVAQKGQAGRASESWTFYFTEINGRLYSLATNSPVEFSTPVAAGSEQLLATLRAGAGAPLNAGTKR